MAIELADKGIAVTLRGDKAGEDTGLSLKDKMRQVEKIADYIEIKQDDISDYFHGILGLLKRAHPVYYIFTVNRPIESKYTTKIDQRTVDEAEQFLPFIHIVDVDFNYILKHHDSVAESHIDKIIKKAKKEGVLVKGSWHDYNGPSNEKELNRIKRYMYKKGVDIYKFCTSAREGHYEDILPVLNMVYDIAHNKDEDGVQRQVVGWAMKKQGRPSRALTWLRGGKYSFVKPPWGQPSADGQAGATVMNALRKNIDILNQAQELLENDSYIESCNLIEQEIDTLEQELNKNYQKLLHNF